MKITITIDGIERIYQGDYYELHARDWNDRVRAHLDDAQDYQIEQEKTKDKSFNEIWK